MSLLSYHLPQRASAAPQTSEMNQSSAVLAPTNPADPGQRSKRFLASLFPAGNEEDSPLWTWLKGLFSGFQEASQALTPIENDAWTADTVLQLVSKARSKRESNGPVDKLMRVLSLPLFTSRTLLTPVMEEERNRQNQTETPLDPTSKTSPKDKTDPYDLDGKFGLFAVIMCALLVSCCAGVVYCHRKPDDQAALIETTITSSSEYSMPFHFFPEDDLPSYEEVAAPPTYDEAVRHEDPEETLKRP